MINNKADIHVLSELGTKLAPRGGSSTKQMPVEGDGEAEL